MSSVIFSEEDEAKIVMDYQPKKLTLNISKQAQNFIGSQPQQVGTSFRISELIAQQTGIQELEKASIEKRIEQKALERLKEIQESAYKEAYSIGKEEGDLRGYEESKQLISDKLVCLDELINRFNHIKVEMLERNEAQMVDLIFYLASKVAHFEIEKNQERIIPVLKSAIESLQKDEKMLIKLSEPDYSIIESLKAKSAKDFEFLVNAKLEISDHIEPGGCVIETNYGLIDASLKERVHKLWEALDTTKPSTKKDEFE